MLLMLCCAVLCCAVLCCAVLCCAVKSMVPFRISVNSSYQTKPIEIITIVTE